MIMHKNISVTKYLDISAEIAVWANRLNDPWSEAQYQNRKDQGRPHFLRKKNTSFLDGVGRMSTQTDRQQVREKRFGWVEKAAATCNTSSCRRMCLKSQWQPHPVVSPVSYGLLAWSMMVAISWLFCWWLEHYPCVSQWQWPNKLPDSNSYFIHDTWQD